MFPYIACYILGIIVYALMGLSIVSTAEHNATDLKRTGARMFVLSPIWPFVVLYYIPGAIVAGFRHLVVVWKTAWK